MFSVCYLLSLFWLLVTPWTADHWSPLSMDFSRQEYWSGLPFLSPGYLPDPGNEPRSPASQQILYCLGHQGSPIKMFHFNSVQSLSRVRLFGTPGTTARQASLSFTNSWSPPKIMSIESVRPSNHLMLYNPLLLPSSIFHNIRVFSNESVLYIKWPKYWSFSFSISPSNEYSGLISFRMDWLDLLVVQGTLKSLLQHHSSKASIPRCSAFFIVQHSQSYMTTGKNHTLDYMNLFW